MTLDPQARAAARASLPLLAQPLDYPYFVAGCCGRVLVTTVEPTACGSCQNAPRVVKVDGTPEWDAILAALEAP